MTKTRQNPWRKWKVSAIATLAVAGLFQYVRSSDAFDAAYAAAKGLDSTDVSSSDGQNRDDVMDEWHGDFRAGQRSGMQEGRNTLPERSYTDGSDADRSYSQGSQGTGWGSGYDSGSYQSRTGAS